MAKNIFYLALCLALTSAIGCGGAPSDMPELGSVTGTVTLAGKPLADAIVEFRPAEGRPSSGKTNETGAYTLQYTSDLQRCEDRRTQRGCQLTRLRTGLWQRRAG